MSSGRCERYLDRIGLDPSRVGERDRETLERLQSAHVSSVPFETLSVTGDPFGPREGEGVSLDAADLFEKIVDRRRGGFCYELNGLFGRLLTDLGFDVQRTAAQIVTDGDARPPANHLTNVVTLDRRYLVDVGFGVPTLRGPLAMDGEAYEDPLGFAWRIVPNDRPDVDYTTQYREPDAEEWTVRHIFRDVPREMHFFAATCEYLATAPESVFTGDPVVTIATERGHRKLSTDTLTRYRDGESIEESVPEHEWYDLLEREFGVRYRPN